MICLNPDQSMPEIQRPITSAERRALQHNLAMIKSLGGLQADLAAHLFGAILFSGLGFGAVYLILKVLGFQPNGPANPLTLGGSALVSLVILALVILVVSGRDLRRRHTWHRNRIDGLEQDLNAGLVVSDDLIITEAKGFVEPEHFMRIYFLKSSDGRVFTLYDYDSANTEGDRSRPTKLRFAHQMTLLRFPVSGTITYTFTGTPLRKPRARPLTAKPDDWPQAETFCDTPWDDLETRLSA
jgi:hypothetical protein